MFLSKRQLKKIGFNYVADTALISDKAVFYSPEKMRIGPYSRIDDFCILSGPVWIGKYVHIGCHSSILGSANKVFNDFSGVSLNCTVLSSSDDYSGEWLTNPMVPNDWRNVKSEAVTFEEHALIGAATVVLPGVNLYLGAVAGACSLVKDDIPAFQIWGGVPAKFIKHRKSDLLKWER